MRKHVSTLFALVSKFLWLCTVSALAQPANDECINAIPLNNVTSWCSPNGQFTTIGSTPSTVPNPSCFPNTAAVNDVWYSFVAVANTVNISVAGNVSNTPGGTISNPQFALYTGACNNLTLVDCASDNMNNQFVQSFISQLVIGQTYYIRVSARFGFRGTFRICVNNYNEVPSPSGDCATAVVLCDKSSFTVPSVTGVGANSNEIGNVGCNGPSCIITESSSTWYKWTCRDPGTLTFILTPLNPSDDLDFVVYELPGGINNCNNKNPIRCMAAGENVGQPLSNWIQCTGPTGLRQGETDANETCGCPAGNNNFLAPINMVAGRSYALVVNNFTNSGAGFTVEFGGTGTFVGPEVDFRTAPTTVCVGQPVTFTDQSFFSGTLRNWTWNFGPTASVPTASTRGPHTVTFNRPGPKPILLTVEADRGCRVSKVIVVNVECCPDHFSIGNASVTDVRCHNQPTGAISPVVSSNFPPYDYFWSNGQTTASIQNLPAGTYTLTITDRATCSREVSFTIAQPPPLETDTLITMPTCNGGTDGAVTLVPRGGVGPYQFNWQNAGFSNNPTLSNIPNGNYAVTIRDVNNCLLPLVIPVRELELILDPTVEAIRPPACNGFSNGSIVVQIGNGRPPYQYDWGQGFVSENSLLNVAAGTYNVTVRDANLCLGLFQFNMEDHPPLALSFEQTNVRCFDEANGSATVVASGGVGNYQYAWSTGGATPQIQQLRAGNYTVTVLDGNNCRTEGQVTITQPPLLTLQVVDSTGLVCSYDTNGRIVLQATGGTPGYSYQLGSQNPQFSPIFEGLPGGTFRFAVTDVQGCTAIATGTVTAPPPLLVDAGPDQFIELGYTADVTILVSQADFIARWSPEIALDCNCAGPHTLQPTSNTTYTVTVTNPNGCIAMDSVTIFVIKNRPIYIPTAISPNGDGINDSFTLFGGPAARQISRLRIFDRWGALVFDRSNLPMGREEYGWDGTFKGRPVNPGVFVFMASIEFIDGQTILYEGDVTVVR